MQKKKRLFKVMAFGAFDVLHPGHLYFLKQAKALGNFLVVSVARDVNIKKIKGRPPVFDEAERLEIIRNLKPVDKAVLGDKQNYLKHILSEKPDVIILGYDQRAYVSSLVKDLRVKKLKIKIVRIKPRNSRRFKSSVIKQQITNIL